ncbi:hypothetical protein D6D13_02518 [Aureobasidium pullulans]|uniref:Bromo domain-containing protein n=1 Tax=Aureobasidium pullulans TaxID=5580 RepID=A0A4S9D682_AURPU|nr:hypothetical protein D6D13_02518 [Aureobasidium pullulans]
MDNQKRAREDALPAESAASKSDAKRVKTDPSVSVVVRESSTTARPKQTLHLPAASDPSSESMRRETEAGLKFCEHILEEFRRFRYNDVVEPFRVPVDPVALNLPNYFDVITHPMGISTITRKLEAGAYESADRFWHDFDLMLQNCFLFNPAENEVHRRGKSLQEEFDLEWSNFDDWTQDYLAKKYTAAKFGHIDTKNGKQPVQETAKPHVLSRNSGPTQMPTKALKSDSRTDQQRAARTETSDTIIVRSKPPLLAPPTLDPPGSVRLDKAASKQTVLTAANSEPLDAKIASIEKTKADAEAAFAANRKIIQDAEAELAASKNHKALHEEYNALKIENINLRRKHNAKMAEFNTRKAEFNDYARVTQEELRKSSTRHEQISTRMRMIEEEMPEVYDEDIA